MGVFVFFKQKTAYEMRISDWSSDVCSSDREAFAVGAVGFRIGLAEGGMQHCEGRLEVAEPFHRRLDEHVAGEEGMPGAFADHAHRQDRKSVVEGKSVSVRVDLRGRRIIKKKTAHTNMT